MPGARSLEKQEYYAHKQNAFWRILYHLYSDIPVPEVFQEKVQFLADNHIALWDVLDHCERIGSLDSNIKNHLENDIPGLLKDFPNIRKIIFNGQQSHKFFLKKFGQIDGIQYEVAPSTSPAYTMKFEDKLAAWRRALID